MNMIKHAINNDSSFNEFNLLASLKTMKRGELNYKIRNGTYNKEGSIPHKMRNWTYNKGGLLLKIL